MIPQLWTVLTVIAATATAVPLAGRADDAGEATAVPASGTGATFNSTTTPSAPSGTSNSTTAPSTWSGTNSSVTTTVPQTGSSGNYTPAKFEFGTDTKMRGVNLGGWLVLETWMTPKLFEGYDDIKDQMGWDERAQNDPALMEKLKNHWATFITADDIQQIADAGLNTVRIPVGYWSLLGGGISGEPYISGALEYLDPIIEKCAELGITVFIVLHGLPGSQNGQDNSGRAMGDNYQWFGNADHKAKSLETVDKAVELYGNGKFGGIVKSIELMNEPKPRWDSDDNLNFQKEYFKEAYENIRSKDKDINVMYSDGWRDPTEQSTWAGFGEGQTGVSMDTHIYTLFSEAAKYGYTKRLEYMCNKKDTLISENRNMQTIVGEWTVAIGMDCDDGDCQAEANDAYKDYLAKQFEWQTWLYEQASGWVYWNWKLDHDDAWSFQTGVKDGWIPKDLGDKPRGGTPCQF